MKKAEESEHGSNTQLGSSPSPSVPKIRRRAAEVAPPDLSRMLVSMVEELRTFVGIVHLNLYENVVKGLGPGPHQHGGAVVATAPLWATTGPLQMAQCRNQN
jgi:hypothetical protein